MRRFVTFLAVVVLTLSTAGVVQGNPHCNGNSDNWHLPNHHTEQDGPPCD